MSMRTTAALAALLAGSTASVALAQEKPADTIECELSGECGTTPTTQVRTSKTRGFSFAPKGSTASSPSKSSSSAASSSSASSGYSASRRPSRSNAPGRRTARALAVSEIAINFTSGSAELSAAGRQQADALYRALSKPKLASHHYLIEGHTDASGDAAMNLYLSRARAQNIVEYLVEKGLARSRFRARGYGEERPLDGVSPSSSSQRRVTVVRLN